MYRQTPGFSALELLVTMTVATILLATGVPAIKNYSWNLRMKTAMDVLQTDLNLARAHAISHNQQTVICPATAIKGCSGRPDWHHGWIVFTDLNGDRHKQNGEPLLKYSGPIESLNISSSRSRKLIRFYPNGTAPGSNVSIRFCDKRGTGHARKILVSNTGRIRLDTKVARSTANCP